jgi:hypothetical protein
MKVNKRIRQIAFLPFVAIVTISFLVAPVAAAFGGSDTPTFATGATLGGHFDESAVDLSTGECTILCTEIGWPWSYPADTTDIAYVGGSESMSEYVTNNWKITADWDIEYELQASWWSCIRVEVWYSVRTSSGGWVFGFEIWSDECQSTGMGVTTVSDTYGEESYQGFGQNLQNSQTYRFCVELRIVSVSGGAVWAHSYYDTDDPVSLTVNSISWAYLA